MDNWLISTQYIEVDTIVILKLYKNDLNLSFFLF